MRVAIVHDSFTQDGGAERVALALRELWPDATVFTLLYDRRAWGTRVGGDVRASFLDRVPLAHSRYRWMMPLMPAAIESLDLRGFDLVVSSTSAFAKGVIVDPGTAHVCYCHTPTRYLWNDRHDYAEAAVPAMARPLIPFALKRLRAWDAQAAARPDRFVANSATVAARIRRYYGRAADVVHPPVDVARFASTARTQGGYFLAGGRLVPYKRMDLVVSASNALGMPVKVFGDGPEMPRLRRMAWNNVEFLGKVDDDAKAELYAGATAYLHPQEEDFGITAVEAMAAGCPVIAYRGGGATETMVDGVTGTFFARQDWHDLAEAMRTFRPEAYDSARIREHAQHFGGEAFARRMRQIADDLLARPHATTPHIAHEPDSEHQPQFAHA
jgi:glycosyltransferase involved in cell wall biosynthesis